MAARLLSASLPADAGTKKMPLGHKGIFQNEWRRGWETLTSTHKLLIPSIFQA